MYRIASSIEDDLGRHSPGSRLLYLPLRRDQCSGWTGGILAEPAVAGDDATISFTVIIDDSLAPGGVDRVVNWAEHRIQRFCRCTDGWLALDDNKWQILLRTL